MIRFFLPEWKEGQPSALPASESKHCIKVLRKRRGEVIRTVDGKGHLLECRILDDHPDKSVVQVEQVLERQSSPPSQLELVVAPTKQMNRMEWMAEKCTEIGLGKLSFVETRYGERPKISKRERLLHKMRSAMKQSRQLWMPQLGGMNSLNELIEQFGEEEISALVASVEPEAPYIGSRMDAGEPCKVLVGPEGGFHDEELRLFERHDIQDVQLGTSILRTETAGVYVSVVSSLIQNI